MLTAIKWLPAFIAWLGIDLHGESGQDLIEYTVLGSLLAGAIFGVAAVLDTSILDFFSNLGNCVDGDASTPCSMGF